MASSEFYGSRLREGVLAVAVTSGVVLGFVWLALAFGLRTSPFGLPIAVVFVCVLVLAQAARFYVLDDRRRRAGIVGSLAGVVASILGLDPTGFCPELASRCTLEFEPNVLLPLGLAITAFAVYVDLPAR